ncbi:MAG TPA: 3-oxoacyl-ACP reductase FabG [Thermoplasmata archaeon]|nr:3-oxoacyl-ACP reductase FabG [Thermoplasmata archaeon]HIH97573.1 3-oxoacyl-ACP reductase FabG [Thermoplasmata archaeon]
MQLEGKNAIVTGGGRNIGRAISIALANKGVNVAINFHKNDKKAQETVEKLEEIGVKSLKIQADVRNFDQVKNMTNRVKKSLGGIDILVNNAGISGQNSTIEKINIEEWKNVIEVNLNGVFNCCKAVEAELRKNKGKVVNISSIAGKMGGSIGCHYAASKAGVIGLTFRLATELAPQVTVNAIAPGPVDTELLSPEIKKKLSGLTPFGRIAKPEEIAHTVVYLLENDYVSGEVIDVNAARYMD